LGQPTTDNLKNYIKFNKASTGLRIGVLASNPLYSKDYGSGRNGHVHLNQKCYMRLTLKHRKYIIEVILDQFDAIIPE
jgi:hypothetical protein